MVYKIVCLWVQTGQKKTAQRFRMKVVNYHLGDNHGKDDVLRTDSYRTP